ncbi:helix-turn-helix domain-containing protein [Streptomyces sp. NPDC055060]
MTGQRQTWSARWPSPDDPIASQVPPQHAAAGPGCTVSAPAASRRTPRAFIRLGCEHRSWTLAALGDRLGCSPATISRLERRSRVVDLALVHRAAQEVGVSRHILMSSLAPPTAKAATATRVTASPYAEEDRCAAVRCSPPRLPPGRSP